MPRLEYALVAGITLFVAVPPQGNALRTLGAPTATWDTEFTGIDGVRELKDGRVIVLDARDKAIHVIDLKTKTSKKIGRDGDGPGEFRLPRIFLPIGGDTTLISDMARFRQLLVVTPAGEIGGFVPTIDSALSTRNFVVGGITVAATMDTRAMGVTRVVRRHDP